MSILPPSPPWKLLELKTAPPVIWSRSTTTVTSPAGPVPPAVWEAIELLVWLVNWETPSKNRLVALKLRSPPTALLKFKLATAPPSLIVKFRSASRSIAPASPKIALLSSTDRKIPPDRGSVPVIQTSPAAVTCIPPAAVVPKFWLKTRDPSLRLRFWP